MLTLLILPVVKEKVKLKTVTELVSEAIIKAYDERYTGAIKDYGDYKEISLALDESFFINQMFVTLFGHLIVKLNVHGTGLTNWNEGTIDESYTIQSIELNELVIYDSEGEDIKAILHTERIITIVEKHIQYRINP